MEAIYLDHNATTPLRPEALEAMREVLEEVFGNPSSAHWAGTRARSAVEAARAQVARLLGAAPETVVFTSSATEANNTVLRSAALRAPQHGDHIVTCVTEHPSVRELCQDLRREGLRVTELGVDSDGLLDPERLAACLDDRTLLVTVMWANNETGVVQPIPEIARVAAARGIPFHTDAVQALGKLELSLAGLPIEFASFSAHKLGGPKGVGALYAREGSRFAALLRGGPQERRRRAGTENVPGIVGFGAACEVAGRDLGERSERLGRLRNRLWNGISSAIPEVCVNGSRTERLPHTLNVAFLGADGETLVEALDLAGIAVASGAACASGSTETSHVLLGMGIPPEAGLGSIRFSLGAETRDAHITRVLELLPEIVERVRGEKTR